MKIRAIIDFGFIFFLIFGVFIIEILPKPFDLLFVAVTLSIGVLLVPSLAEYVAEIERKEIK